MVTKLLTNFERINEYSDKFSKDTANRRKYQVEFTELKNIVTKLENTSRGSTEECDWSEQQKEKELKKSKDSLRVCMDKNKQMNKNPSSLYAAYKTLISDVKTHTN